jgi:hypothetical protein
VTTSVPPALVEGPAYCACPVCGVQVWDLHLTNENEPVLRPADFTIRYRPPSNVWHAWPCGHAWTGGGDVDLNALVYTWHSNVREVSPIALKDRRTGEWRRIG